MGFKRILVALDRSAQTPYVFEQALAQAQHQKGDLLLLHAIHSEPEIPAGSFMGLGTIADVDTYGTLKRLHHERRQKEIQQAEGWLNTYQQQAAAIGITAKVDCRVGEAAVLVCELAQSWGADLIVMGRRGHQGIREVVLGSVSNYVVHHATCSVLILQGI